MPLILIGTNHRSAPVELRERLAIPEEIAAEVLAAIRAIESIRGAAVLSTCNRVEVVVSAEDEDVIEPVVDSLTRRTGGSRADLERHLYVLRNRDVVRHFFRVASGLDSMIVGEPQIGGQVRAAYALAQENGALDPILQRLFEQTLRVAKKVRSESGIGESAVSIPYAAVELARKIFGELGELQVLLLGAGDMGELTAQHLRGAGVRRLLVANRAQEKARDLATRFAAEAVGYERINEVLGECDIVIASTAAPHHVLTAADVRIALTSRRGRSLFLVDLSVPRNLDPAISALDGAYLYDIDDLGQVVGANLEKRGERSTVAERIVETEVESFLERQATDDAIPTIVELRSRLEEIRTSELDKCLRRVGPVSAEQREAIEALTTSIINKVLHYPIVRLKESVGGERESLRQTIRKIFGLR